MSSAAATAAANWEALTQPSLDPGVADRVRLRSQMISEATRLLLEQAITRRASDFLVEKRNGLDGQQSVRCMMRVDDATEDVAQLPPDIGHYVLRRFKNVAGLRLASEQPQEGSFDLPWFSSGSQVTLRLLLSTTGAHDSLVVRLQYPDEANPSTEDAAPLTTPHQTDTPAYVYGPKPVPGRPQGMGGVTTGVRAYP